jgi:large subunit ribosomal protein L10
MAKVELKQPVVQEIAEKIKDAQALVLVDHRGLTVAQDTELRKKLREEGVSYKVYKNTMMNFAFEGTDFAQLKDLLNGPSAMAVSATDPAAPARVLYEFAKKAKALEIKGGVIEGKFYDAEAMTEIATIPSREVLLSRLLGSMQSPIANLARVLNQIAENGGEAAPKAEEAAEEAPAETAEAPAAEEAAAPAEAAEAPAAE